MDRFPRGAGELLAALVPLVSAHDRNALTAAAASLSQRALAADDTCVLLRTQGTEEVARAGRGSAAELEPWVRTLSEGDAPGEAVSSGRLLGVSVAPDSRDDVRCVIAAASPSVAVEAAREILVPLARLVVNRAADLERCAREEQALREARAFMGKGLHDLRTPLNSLRLGMHLLAPGLATQDPAVVDRTNRAIDRMAALVTEMFDALHKS